MIIVGEKEKKENSISLRRRKIGNIGTLKINDFISNVLNEIINKEIFKDKE